MYVIVINNKYTCTQNAVFFIIHFPFLTKQFLQVPLIQVNFNFKSLPTDTYDRTTDPCPFLKISKNFEKLVISNFS